MKSNFICSLCATRLSLFLLIASSSTVLLSAIIFVYSFSLYIWLLTDCWLLSEVEMFEKREEEIDLDSKEFPSFNVFNALGLDISAERPSTTVITQHYRTAVRLAASQNRTPEREHLAINGDNVPTQQEVKDAYQYLKGKTSNWIRSVDWVRKNSTPRSTWNPFAGCGNDGATRPVPTVQDTPQRIECQTENKPRIASSVFKEKLASSRPTARRPTYSSYQSNLPRTKSPLPRSRRPEFRAHCDPKFGSTPAGGNTRRYTNWGNTHNFGPFSCPFVGEETTSGTKPTSRPDNKYSEDDDASTTNRSRSGSRKVGSEFHSTLNYTSLTYTTGVYTHTECHPIFAEGRFSSGSRPDTRNAEDQQRGDKPDVESRSPPDEGYRSFFQKYKDAQRGMASCGETDRASYCDCRSYCPTSNTREQRCEPKLNGQFTPRKSHDAQQDTAKMKNRKVEPSQYSSKKELDDADDEATKDDLELKEMVRLVWKYLESTE